LPKPDSQNKIRFVVSDESNGLRLDKFLGLAPEIGTRSKAALLLETGSVWLNGKSAKASAKVSSGQIVEALLPPAVSSTLEPLHLELEIPYEDADCLVVNKPAGLVVHPAAGHAQDTLVNALIAQVKNLAMGFGEHRPGIVHRLDKDTSGLLAVAKTNSAQEILAAQFKAKTVDRHYWAIVYGEPKQKRGRIESKLARHPTQRKKFSSRPVGKIAITNYEVLQSASGLSLVRCRLETGRTHQIRVHLTELGHPIVGDLIYGSSRWASRLGKDLKTRVEAMNRIGLHAYELGFALPSNGERKKFVAAWPSDLQDLIKELGFSDVSRT
jgi:23S rRNA pseudouridine1911/1915/1917 synthase